MAKDNIFVDTKQLNKIAIELKSLEKEVPGAVASALNRTVDHINTNIARMVTQEYAIKVGDVKKTIKKNKASRGELSASLVSKGHTLSFAHFPYTPKKLSRKKVKVTIKRSSGKVSSKAGFVAPTGAESEDKIQYNVFKRLGKFKIADKGSHEGEWREMIAPIRTLSVPQMIGNVNIKAQIQEEAQKKLNERIEHEIAWRLDNAAKNIKK